MESLAHEKHSLLAKIEVLEDKLSDAEKEREVMLSLPPHPPSAVSPITNSEIPMTNGDATNDGDASVSAKLTANDAKVKQLELECMKMERSLQKVQDALTSKDDLLYQVSREAEDMIQEMKKREADWQVKVDKVTAEVCRDL